MAFANAFRPNGFDPSQHTGRTDPSRIARPALAGRAGGAGAVNGDLAIGDAYGLDGNGNAVHAGATTTVVGIVRGFRFQANGAVMGGNGPVSIDYLPASVAGTVIGMEDQSTLFEVQADTFAVANIGKPFNLLDAASDPVLRQSRQSLNIGGGAGTQFLIIDIVKRPTDNAYGANARVLCRLLTANNGIV